MEAEENDNWEKNGVHKSPGLMTVHFVVNSVNIRHSVLQKTVIDPETKVHHGKEHEDIFYGQTV